MDKDVADVAYDSRKTVKGGMFVAIQGTVVDGHKFIDSAVEAGAEVIVAEKETGNMFIAMRGTQVDGHQFIPKAVELELTRPREWRRLHHWPTVRHGRR